MAKAIVYVSFISSEVLKLKITIILSICVYEKVYICSWSIRYCIKITKYNCNYKAVMY